MSSEDIYVRVGWHSPIFGIFRTPVLLQLVDRCCSGFPVSDGI